VSAAANQAFADYGNAFEDAITRYSPTLFRVALRRLRNIEDAEDAVQDALLSAYKHIGQFEGRSQLSTWLTTIVSNVALMKLRRHSRYETFSLDREHENDGTAYASELKDASPNPEAMCAQSEMNEKLRRALDRLSPKQRSAIQLCELEGFTMREAAHALGISTNTLKSRVSRARAALGLLVGEVIGTGSASKAPAAVDRIIAVRLKRSSPEPSEATVAAARPIGYKTRIRKSRFIPVRSRNATYNDGNAHIEDARNRYPPHSLEYATHSQPQGYAT
jgi:RNA polymerase sigma factor (sigma-70 family)